MNGKQIGKEIELTVLPEFKDVPREWHHDYPRLFIEYVPNLESIDEYWGASDYEDIESLQDALNNRISNIDEVLDKHSNPILVLPTGIMREDPTTGRLYSVSADRDAIETNDPDLGAKLPRYVTWEAQLDAAFSEIDKIMDTMMLVSQMSPALFGRTTSYAADSAKALKLRMIQTLAKVNDKQMPYDTALKNILFAAQWLEYKNKPNTPEPESVRIEWRDGLPDDELEITQIHATRVAAGIESKYVAIKAVQGMEGQHLEDEIIRIQKDQGILVDNPYDVITTEIGADNEPRTES